MNIFNRKLKRGVLYHTPLESFKYLINSIFSNIDNKDEIKKFELEFAKYNEQDYCLAFPFARTAIYFILKNLNLPKGTEVIMSPISIKGILDVILDLGLVPKYIDLDLETLNYKLDDLSASINTNSKVAIVTYLFGLVPNMEKIVKTLQEKNIFIIEDFSQCLNGRYNNKRIGSYGDVGVYSSSSIKTLDTLGGGLIVTNNKSIFDKLKNFQDKLLPVNRLFLVKKSFINLYRNMALIGFIYDFFTFPLLQLIRLVNPKLALKQTGNKNKNRINKLPSEWFGQYSSVQAKIGMNHLEKCIENDTKRIKNVKIIKESLGNNRFPLTTVSSYNVYWQLLTVVINAQEAQAFLSKKGIDVATSSLELLSSLSNYPNKIELTNAKIVYENGLLIPCYPGLRQKDLEYISFSLKSYFEEMNHA